MYNKKIIWFLFLGFLSISAVSQSLDELESDMFNSNQDIHALTQEYYAVLERAPQVSQMPDPEFGIGLSVLPVETRLGPQIARLGATQMIPWKGLLNQAKDLEIAKAKPVQESKEALMLNLVFELKQAYFRLYEIAKSQLIIDRYLQIFHGLERLVLSKVESGKASTADVLRVQLSIEELLQESDILEQAKISPATTINQLLDRNLSTPIVIVDSLDFSIIPFNKEQLLTQLGSTHPLMRMFNAQQEIARESINLNGLQSKPIFGIGLDYVLVNKRDVEELRGNGRDIVQLRAAIKIPLNKEKYRAKEREENLRIKVLDHKKSGILNRLLADIEKSYAQYETALLQLNLYEKQVELTESAKNILQAEYSASGNRFDELLRLERDLIEYDFKMLKAIVQSHVAKSSIERFVNY